MESSLPPGAVAGEPSRALQGDLGNFGHYWHAARKSQARTGLEGILPRRLPDTSNVPTFRSNRCQRTIVNSTLYLLADAMPNRPHPSIPPLLPVKPVELLVLTMLAAGERHGYGIRQDILDHTGGTIALEAGNLYRTIRRLEADGWVGESERQPSADSDADRRRYNRLPPIGRHVLAAALEPLSALV